MAKKVFSAEQIVAKLREIEVLMAQGKSVALACKEAGISDQSYFRWRREYGGLKLDQARRRTVHLFERRSRVDFADGFCATRVRVHADDLCWLGQSSATDRH